jgi:NADH-quinone oxidoreductase subunit I
MAKVVSFRRTLWEQLYVPELIRGMSVTLRHFFNNTLLRPWRNEIVTVRYPEERREYPPRFRSVHRLMKREDGTVRCVACMMCSTICPANCIHIEAGEREDDSGIEKYPVRFEIDELLCVVCGMCVEACPCDAIRMDSGHHMPPVEHRYQALLHKEDLLARGTRSIAVSGGHGPDWREKYNPVLGEHRAIYDREGEYNKHLKGS